MLIEIFSKQMNLSDIKVLMFQPTGSASFGGGRGHHSGYGGYGMAVVRRSDEEERSISLKWSMRNICFYFRSSGARVRSRRQK